MTFPIFAQSGKYAPVITDEPADCIITATDDFTWSRQGDVLTITGTFLFENEITGPAHQDGGGNFSLPTLPPGLAASFGFGVGAGFWEDNTRPATFLLNDDGDGFVLEHFMIDQGFSAPVRFTFTVWLGVE